MKTSTTCPACGASRAESIKPWRLGRGHHAVACCECGLLFVHPQPAQEVLDAYYAPDGGWQASRDSDSPHPPHTRKKGGAPLMFAALDQFFAASAPKAGARVFDFGCGPGTWLNSFQDHGWDTYGLEPASDVAFAGHKQLRSIPSEPRFDLVIAYHVLEHLPRPLETLRRLAATIHPGGYCMVSVPRLDTLAVHGDFKYCLHPRNHIVAFTEACLRGLLARAGLETVAALHHLDEKFSKGAPIRLRLVARKATAPLPLEPNPAAALKPVIGAFVELRRMRDLTHQADVTPL